MANLKFKKVNVLPSSGYSEGDVYFVKSEKKIYVRTATGWEDYGGSASGGSDVASKLFNPRLDESSSPVISVGNAAGDDQTFSVVHSEDYSNEEPVIYEGATIKLRHRTTEEGALFEYGEANISGMDIVLKTFDGTDHVGTHIYSGNIRLNDKDVITEGNIHNYLPVYTKVLSTNTTETFSVTNSTIHYHEIGTVILTNTSGTKTIKLPPTPSDGRTVTILRIGSTAFKLSTVDGKSMQKVTGTSTVTDMNLNSAGKYTCIYSSSSNRWYIMRDDFVSL